MADQYLVDAGGNWSAAATWESVPGGGDDTGPPLDAESVEFTDSSGDVAIDANTNAIASLTIAALYTGTITATNTIDVDGNAEFGGADLVGAGAIEVEGDVALLAGGDWSGYTGTLTQDGAAGTSHLYCGTSGPALEINNNGVTSFIAVEHVNLGTNTLLVTAGKFDLVTFELTVGLIDIDGGLLDTGSGDATTTDLDMAGGTLDGTGDIAVNGDITITGGTYSHTGALIHGADGDVEIASGTEPPDLQLAGAGVTSTLTAASYAKKITLGTGEVTGTALLVLNTDVTDSWQQDPANTFSALGVRVYVSADSLTFGPFYLASVGASGLSFRALSATRASTANGAFDLGARPLTLYSTTDGEYMKLDMNGHRLKCGAVTLGWAGADKGGGKLDLSTGNHEIGSIAKAADSDAAENALDFGSSTTALGTSIDGTGLTCTCAGGVVVGGEIDDVDLSGSGELLHIYPAALSETNDNVTQIESLGFMAPDCRCAA